MFSVLYGFILDGIIELLISMDIDLMIDLIQVSVILLNDLGESLY